MKFKLLFVLVFANVWDADKLQGIEPQEETDYYVNLVETETTRTETYPIPIDSSFFRPSNSYKISDYGQFDYIIVGAGSAGAVIASRLSEIPGNKVLLLEAGGHETNFSDIPQMASYLQRLQFNWNFKSTQQTTCCLGMSNKQFGIPRGRGLGGTSIINSLLYVRGHKIDYDNWFKQWNPAWAYKDVLPYFIKSENSTIRGDAGYHGHEGYLNVQYVTTPYSPQFQAFIQANLELGRKIVDYNGRQMLGVAEMQYNVREGRRVSTGKAFITPALNRENLQIRTRNLVIKIEIKPVLNKAVGVIFSYGGKLFRAKAHKEVIISAGAIGSPQLLMLSGIGPKDHLREMRIPIVKDLPVGFNYQNHPAYRALHFVANYTEPVKSLTQNIQDYLQGVGAFTVAETKQGVGFYQTKFVKVSGYPDIELIITPSNITGRFVMQVNPFNNATYNTIWKDIDPQRTFAISVILLHPKSRGRVKLKSQDPYEYPDIDPKIFSDDKGEDIERLYEGIQLALELLNTTAFKKLNTSLRYAPLPSCAQHDYLSKRYWYCQLKHVGYNVNHPVGTCKMGPKKNPSAVVDHHLKVHGIKNLRVADASIMPDIISGHTNAAAIMIGEKVSDMIKISAK